ncbi:MAG TPA: hypothetical protein VGP45_03540, partial [Marinobacter sp.]|nr:hypothetical protein [Marinobacter sp.]
MSVVLLLLSALVLIYLSIGGKTASVVLCLATLIGLAQDDWHLVSFVVGGLALALALILQNP